VSAGRFVRAGVVRTIGAFLARYPGVDAERLLAGAGIDAAMLADPDALLTFRAWAGLFEAAAAETGDQAFGIGYAEQLPWKDLGVLAYVVFHSPTVGAAFANGVRYFAVQQTAGRPAIEIEGDAAHLSYAIDDPTITAHGQHSEGALLLFVRIGRDGARADFAPREVRLRHRAPERDAQHRIAKAFGCPVTWSQPRDEVVVAAADFRLPMRDADPGLLPILLRHADECLAKMPSADDFVGNVRRLVVANLSSGDVTIEDIAARVGLSARSLQRRLQDSGSSFKDVVDEARLALARRYLEDPKLTLTEAAFLLGYSELSAFSRAFRRWTGTTAVAYRNRAKSA
jgi:AraC-like DNA-binding protein